MPPRAGCGWEGARGDTHLACQHSYLAPRRGQASSWTSPGLFWAQCGPAGCSAPPWGPIQPPFQGSLQPSLLHVGEHNPTSPPLLSLLGRQELLSSIPIMLQISPVPLCQRWVWEVGPGCCVPGATWVARGDPHVRLFTAGILSPAGRMQVAILPLTRSHFSHQILYSSPHPEAAPGSGHTEGTPSGQPSPA